MSFWALSVYFIQNSWNNRHSLVSQPINRIFLSRRFNCLFVPQIRQLHVACNPNFSFSNFLAKPTTVREWNIQVCIRSYSFLLSLDAQTPNSFRLLWLALKNMTSKCKCCAILIFTMCTLSWRFPCFKVLHSLATFSLLNGSVGQLELKLRVSWKRHQAHDVWINQSEYGLLVGAC